LQAQMHDPAACFAESVRIFAETRIEVERARSLLAWAEYEMDRGNQARALDLTHEAQAIFARLELTAPESSS
jgi:hypothetical protein